MPTGTVTFTIDGAAQTPVALSNGQATFSTSTLSAGTHIVTAAYSGDGNFNGGTSAALSHTVNQTKAATTTVIHSSAPRTVLGHPVTLTAVVAAVTPGGGVPTGTVTFTVDGKIHVTGTLVNGTASFTTSDLTVGSHVIVATYNGNSNSTGSASSPLTLTVEQQDQREHHHRHCKEDHHDNDHDHDDAQCQHSGGRTASHSDPILQWILALKTRILSRCRKT